MTARIDSGELTPEPTPSSGVESSRSEVDDQFRALLEGLRTTIPGVTVLFAFLLTLPLQAGFSELQGMNQVVFYVAFAASAASTVLIIAPSVHQRVRAPISGIRPRQLNHVMVATYLATMGTVLFLIAIAASVYLVSDLVLTRMSALVASLSITSMAGWAWFWLPLVAFRTGRDDQKSM